MKKIFLDMDGILVDFATPVLKRHGFCYDDCKGVGLREVCKIGQHQLNEQCDSLDFWAGLEPMPDADKIIEACNRHVGTDNIFVLTNPGSYVGASLGKKIWIGNHYPSLSRNLVITENKEACSCPWSLLVEDLEKNIVRFQRFGGSGILVPRPWNKDWEQADNAFAVFKQRLDSAFLWR